MTLLHSGRSDAVALTTDTAWPPVAEFAAERVSESGGWAEVRLKVAPRRHEVGMPTAEDAVLTRLTEQGPAGAFKWMWYGRAMVLKERLDRAHASKSEWQAVRPVFQALVNRYAASTTWNPRRLPSTGR
ncbi:MAG TPA: hypothetical protein VIT42_04595 [Microlunatus sp.]